MTDPLPTNSMTFKGYLRLLFVVFSLYLMGDALSRWDGFSYYAPFSEFIPSVALAFILWSIVALFTALIIWLIFEVIERFVKLLGVEVATEHLFLNACLLVMLSGLVWKAKRMLWPDIQTTLELKLAVLLCLSLVSVCLTWLFRKKAERFAVNVQERITPLVWLFGIILVASLPLVTYHGWIKRTDNGKRGEVTREQAAGENCPNIILVTFDALAASNMSLYGYHRETTPFITEWAEDAAVFNRVEAGSNFTTPAVASLMTGKRVWTHQTYHIAGSRPVRSNVESLPVLLKDNGYFTMAFITNPFASIRVLGMENGFDIAPLTSEFGEPASFFGWKFGTFDVVLYRMFGDKIRLHNWILRNDFILSKAINLISRNVSRTTVPPNKTFDRFFDVIDGNIQEPFFAWIHLFPPHDPYLPPEPFKGDYNASNELRTYKNQQRVIEESYKYLFQYQEYPEEMQPAVTLMRDYYDEFVKYIDTEFEGFIAALTKRKMDDTVLILSADHGESFEHGYLTHGGPFLYEQVTQVPLIIKVNKMDNGLRVNQFVEQIDIPATILDIANIPVPAWMEGRSLLPFLHGEKLPLQPVFSMNLEGNPSLGHQIDKGSIAIWENNYKLIHYIARNESILFDLGEDPAELNNIIEVEPEISQRLLDLLLLNLDKVNMGRAGQ